MWAARVGDTIAVGGEAYQVVGLLAYVNYSTLHENPSDFMFDALKFDVAMVTDEGFGRLTQPIHYSYAWQYKTEPEDEIAEKALSDGFLKALLTQTVVGENELEGFLPRYANPAINFAREDMGSDEAMGGVILDVLIVIIAFIFAVTITNTIEKEAKAIGTLRASGYTRWELIRHYLSVPVIVTLIAAAVGNLLGYTVFKYVVVSMYYNSYSLPVYETVWNPEAFIKTTIIPLALMFLVNLFVIWKTLLHTPLQFLRQDLKKSKKRRAPRLPEWKFFRRFRMRVMLQNLPNYLILFFGIFFVMVLLAMAVGMPDTLAHYQSHAAEMMFSQNQYVLTDWEDGAFTGYLSDSEITDIPDEQIATVITIREITKMCDQLDHSMGAYMQYFQVLCILLSAVLIYLLTKIIIEKKRDLHLHDQDPGL